MSLRYFKVLGKQHVKCTSGMLYKCIMIQTVYSYRTSSEIKYSEYFGKHVKELKSSKIENFKGSDSIHLWAQSLKHWYAKYEDFVGITDLKRAQDKVTGFTNSLLEVQTQRRKYQASLEKAQEQLIDTHLRITKTELYSEEHYSLFEKARELKVCVDGLKRNFQETEESERNIFTLLSTAIRDCHEKERTHAENSKYWSIAISAVSAVVASLVTSINNWIRIKEIKDHSSALSVKVMEKLTNVGSVIESRRNFENISHHIEHKSELGENVLTQVRESLSEVLNKLSVEKEPMPVHEPFVENHYRTATIMGIGAAVGAVTSVAVFVIISSIAR